MAATVVAKALSADSSGRPTSRTRTPAAVWTFRLLLFAGLAAVCAIGGPVTRAAAGFALVFALWGDFDGAVRHVCRIFALLLAFWLAPQAGVPLGRWLAPHVGLAPVVAHVIATTTVGLAVVAVGALLGRGFSRQVRRSPVFKGLDHVGGALVGTAEGALIVASACWLLTLCEQPLAALSARAVERGVSSPSWVLGKFEAVRAAVRSDPAGRLFTSCNPLPEIPAIQTAQQMLDVMTTPGALATGMDDEALRDFRQRPEVKKHVDALQSDAELRSALESGDLAAVLQSRAFTEMLQDGELYEAVVANWGELSGVLARLDVDEIKAAGAARQTGASKAAANRLDERTRRAAGRVTQSHDVRTP